LTEDREISARMLARRGGSDARGEFVGHAGGSVNAKSVKTAAVRAAPARACARRHEVRGRGRVL